MRKGKVGLQKEISKIFTGVQIPKQDSSNDSPRQSETGPAQYIPPKPIPPSPRTFTIPEPAQYVPPRPNTSVYEPPKASPAPPPPPEPPPKRRKQIPWQKILHRITEKLLAAKSSAGHGRQRLMVIVAPVLLLVLIIALVNLLRTPSGAAAKSQKKFTPSGVAAFNGQINWEPPPLYPDTLRDPMVFGSFTNTAQGQQQDVARPAVRGIVFSEDNPRAVIGEQIVSVGDTVGGATIVKINPDSVEFMMDNKTWVQKVER